MNIPQDGVFDFRKLPEYVRGAYDIRWRNGDRPKPDDTFRYFDHSSIEIEHLKDSNGEPYSVIAWCFEDSCNQIDACKGHVSGQDVYEWMLTYDPPR